ncbi:MAG: sulfotransferase family 2 domain-containing protein [Woeseiaceae bacterium]|nr:sulfotransferase family 2 domain-containing protein [Woeseiaceae bacterium]
MIAHKLKTIFIHIPKTAGSSIEVALNEVEQREDGAVDPMTGEFVNVITGTEKHMTARACREFVGDEVWNSYFKFSVVRNPFDRFHSLWWNGRHVARRHALSMHEFANAAFHRGVRGRLISWRQGLWKVHQRYWPQTRWLRSPGGEIEMDQVLKFENIAADFAQLAGRIGLPSTELPKVLMKNRRPSSRRPYVEDYDSETRRIVTDYYREDLEAFGYEFE